jgi:hypothetical protein
LRQGYLSAGVVIVINLIPAANAQAIPISPLAHFR